MKREPLCIVLAFSWFAAPNAPAAVLYVDANSASPTPPFTNWSTAATNIQDAVDAAVAGDQILVTNGIYQFGGKAVFGTMTNRVAVDKPVALQGVNGPLLTIIQGYQVPGSTNGDGAIRCVYLANGASLAGFTLTNGATRAAGDVLHEQDGGGLWCESTAEVVSNCVLIGNSAFRAGGGAEGGMLDGCTVQGNSADSGGGADRATLNNCVVTGNSAAAGLYGVGGGTSDSILDNCVLARNSASDSGGGAYYGRLTNCVLRFNSARYGGGAAYSDLLVNCVLTNNSALDFYNGIGGGVFGRSGLDPTRLINCTVRNNTAAYGGGVCSGTLTNCTLEGNYAYQSGGGAAGGRMDNCMITGNRAGYGGGVHTSVFGEISRLNNCTLTDNLAYRDGGGALEGTLSNCVLMRNSARDGEGGGACGAVLNNCTFEDNSAYSGGGASGGTFNNCRFRRNSASFGGGVNNGILTNCTLTANSATNYSPGAFGYGGGAASSSLNNCTLAGNSANQAGGGTYYSSLTNCIIYYNQGGNCGGTFSLDHCCAIPAGGTGNFTNAPVFVDTNGWANLRLQSNSPCINAGTNVLAAGSTDLDGRPRIQDGTVDLGAYEFQPAASGEFIGWLSQFALPTDGSADYVDSDGDGLNNWQEWIACTVPTDASSALRLLTPTADSSGITVSWQSVTNRTYLVERNSNLGAQPPFSLLASNLIGQAGTTSFTDTNSVGPGPFFYRVGVQQ
jgi:hypothetical protein